MTSLRNELFSDGNFIKQLFVTSSKNLNFWFSHTEKSSVNFIWQKSTIKLVMHGISTPLLITSSSFKDIQLWLFTVTDFDISIKTSTRNITHKLDRCAVHENELAHPANKDVLYPISQASHSRVNTRKRVSDKLISGQSDRPNNVFIWTTWSDEEVSTVNNPPLSQQQEGRCKVQSTEERKSLLKCYKLP